MRTFCFWLYLLLLTLPLTSIGQTPAANGVVGKMPGQEEAPAPETVEPPTEWLKRPEQQAMELLADSVETDQRFWLEDSSGQFLTLYQRDNTGSPFGAVLLFHAEGEHALSPRLLLNLFTDLPDNGWNTATTNLPDPSKQPIPERDFFPVIVPKNISSEENQENSGTDKMESDDAAEAGSQAGENSAPESKQETDVANKDETEKAPKEDGTGKPEENSEPSTENEGETTGEEVAETEEEPPKPRPQYPEPPAPEELAQARLKAVYTFMHSKGQLNLNFIAFGSSAPRVMNFFDTLSWPTRRQQQLTGAIRPVQSLVIINGRNTLPTTEDDLAKMLKDPELPVLDIYDGTDLRDRKEAKRRLSYARRNGMMRYHQVMLPELSSSSHSNNRLIKRVRGFLQKYAKGQEVKAAISR